MITIVIKPHRGADNIPNELLIEALKPLGVICDLAAGNHVTTIKDLLDQKTQQAQYATHLHEELKKSKMQINELRHKQLKTKEQLLSLSKQFDVIERFLKTSMDDNGGKTLDEILKHIECEEVYFAVKGARAELKSMLKGCK